MINKVFGDNVRKEDQEDPALLASCACKSFLLCSWPNCTIFRARRTGLPTRTHKYRSSQKNIKNIISVCIGDKNKQNTPCCSGARHCCTMITPTATSFFGPGENFWKGVSLSEQQHLINPPSEHRRKPSTTLLTTP